MVDFRTSGVSKGGLGFASRTRNISSSSSLDKRAGTLSRKSSADLALAGQSAQQLLKSVPRTITKDFSVAQRSQALASTLINSDVLLNAQTQLINKFVAQASPTQQQQLLTASRTGTTQGFQRAITEKIKENAGLKDVTGTQGSNFQRIAVIIGAIAAVGFLIK